MKLKINDEVVVALFMDILSYIENQAKELNQVNSDDVMKAVQKLKAGNDGITLIAQ